MKGRNQSIDALRGVAALLVMILHITGIFLLSPQIRSKGVFLNDFFEYIDIGRIGITIFFLISGFVICKSIRSTEKNAVWRFFIKRVFRLYPLFWFSMITGLIFIWYLNDRSIDLPLIVANATMLPAFFNEPFIIGLYWTLETELIFYLLVAIFFVAGLLKNPVFLFLFTVILYSLFFLIVVWFGFDLPLPHWKATPYHLGLMIFGILYRYESDGDKLSGKFMGYAFSGRTILLLQFILVTLVPLAVLIQFLTSGIWNETSDAIAYLIAIGLFLTGTRLWKRPSEMMIFLGTISYSIYLMHPVVMHIVLNTVQTNPFLDGAHVIIYVLASSILTIIVSYLTYTFLENPINRYGHKLAYLFRKPLDKLNESVGINLKKE